ncbi:MAG: hypothetical protein AB1801_04400 [Chloroflexota bacterium]
MAEAISDPGPVNLWDIAVDLGALGAGNISGLENRLLYTGAGRLVMRGKTPKVGQTTLAVFFDAADSKAVLKGKIPEARSRPLLIRDNKILPDGLSGDPASIQRAINKVQRNLGGANLALILPNRFNRLTTHQLPSAFGKTFTAAEFLEGGMAGFIFDTGWQVVQDWDNPYLSPSEKVYRGLTAGTVGLVAGIGVVLLVGTGPAGFILALPVGWFIEAPISEVIFQWRGWVPKRKLAPLTETTGQ